MINESLLSPSTCSFAKVAAIFASKEAHKTFPPIKNLRE